MTVSIDTATLPLLDSLPDSVFELTALLQSEGWKVSMTSDTHVGHTSRMRITAEAPRWLNMVVSGFCYGYFSHDSTEQSVIVALKKMVTLCTEMKRVFHDKFPSSRIDSNGILRDDPELLEASKKGNVALLEHISASFNAQYSKSTTRSEAAVSIMLKGGVICLGDGLQISYLSEHDVKHIARSLS